MGWKEVLLTPLFGACGYAFGAIAKTNPLVTTAVFVVSGIAADI